MTAASDASPLIVVDTDVWLDLYLPNRAGRDDARRFVERAIACGASLLYTVQTANDVFARVSINAKRWVREGKGEIDENYARAIKGLAWDCVASMRELGTAVGADDSDLWLAQKYRELHDDFEDDLILAACTRVSADYLVTNDAKLLRHAPVAALTPADVCVLLAP